MKKDSQEFKQLQRDRINRTKPWLKSTGARTPEGKKKSSMNARSIAYEHNKVINDYRNIFKLLKKQYDKVW